MIARRISPTAAPAPVIKAIHLATQTSSESVAVSVTPKAIQKILIKVVKEFTMKRVCILGSAPKKLLLTETAIVTLICTTYLETAAWWKKKLKCLSR